MKLTTLLKWFLPMLLLASIGTKLIVYSEEQEKKHQLGFETYAAASEAFKSGDAKTAYELYLQSIHELENPADKAVAAYEAANVGWAGGIADYHTLVGLYQQSLRYNPEFYEAAINLEYLYWLKTHSPEELPQPNPGKDPSREEEVPNGDV